MSQWGNIIGEAAPLTRETLDQAVEALRSRSVEVRPHYQIMSIEEYERRMWPYRLIACLKGVVESRMPYYLRRGYNMDEAYPWVTARCRFLYQKGQKEFRRYHC